MSHLLLVIFLNSRRRCGERTSAHTQGISLSDQMTQQTDLWATVPVFPVHDLLAFSLPDPWWGNTSQEGEHVAEKRPTPDRADWLQEMHKVKTPALWEFT